MTGQRMTGWSVCIATLNRAEALRRAILHVLQQTVPPGQIVIVDASANWQDSRDSIAAMLVAHPAIRLDYLHSPVRSSATQRNTGIAQCTEDIIFLIDDDSFLYPDCAEQILAIYGTDPAGDIAAIRTDLADTPPPVSATDFPALQRKESGNRGDLAPLKTMALGSRFGRWFHRRVLMQSMRETFLRYDGPRQRPLPAALQALGVEAVSFMPGCAMTVRRGVALTEPFDTALRYYAAYEDVDVSYRYAKHGHVLFTPRARLHHFEAASGRLDRRKVIAFQLLNMVVFLRRHADNPDDWTGRYQVMMYRRLLGEFLKDLLSGRTAFPQMRGVLLARRYWRGLWAVPPGQLDDYYPELQRRILEQ